ncbi:MAG: ABC transporter substrate-binding protein [Puniceicoccales bacterium]|jgi:ABC-type uncharacterized transport system substrate-binding protein|nr:ABC transporter substrate-binding protein [Puniceicoccales bacterium]
MGKLWEMIFGIVAFAPLPIGGAQEVSAPVLHRVSGGDRAIYPSERTGKKIKILLLLWRGKTAAEQGFLEELDALGYEAATTIINVEGNLKRLNQILHGEINFSDYDYVYTFGTLTSLVASGSFKNSIPIIFNAVSHPFRVGLVASTENNNGGKLSGVCTSAPMEDQLKNIQTILPLKNLAVLVDPKEQNCLDGFDALEEAAKKQNITLLRFAINGEEEIQTALAKIGKVDAIYVTSSSFFEENAKLIFDHGRSAKIPMVAEQMNMISNGALMGTAASYTSSGKVAAKILDINCKFKVPISAIPVQFPEFFCSINKNTAKILDIQISDAQANDLKINWIED